jgi:hypothetical protein
MSSTKTQETKLPQWQEDFIREQILPRGIDIAETEYTPYEGELIAGMTPLQEQALSGFGSLDTGGQTYEEAIDVQRGLSSFAPGTMSAATAGPASTYGGATVADTSAYGGATIDQIERARAAELGEVERMQGVGAVRSARAPGQIGVDTLARTDFDPYLSPYTQNVIELGQQDIERQRQMASNTLGAQAEAAGAFGGSRQAVQEGVLAGEALRQAGALSAQQRQQAFTQALQSGQFDIGNVQQARALQSGQQMTAETLGQQAREAAAARDQAARAGNMAAANQFAQQQAQLEQQAVMANQAAANARAQAQAQLSQQAGLAAAQQAAARASQQAGLTQTAGLSNQAALNQAMQAEAARQQAANAANFQGQFQAAGIQSGAANAMAGLAGQQLQSELTGLGAQMSAGEQARALEQAQLQADYAMFQEQQAYPLSQLNAVLAAGSGIPAGLGTVSTRDPFGGLTAVGNLLGGFGSAGQGYTALTSDIRLKENITPAGSQGGINFYTWDWNEEGKKVAPEGQPTFGVMAQELEATHPDLVVIGEDGYRRVKYDELYKRIGR